MSVETHRVLMGTCGWKHKAWLNDFYSEDLPEEWQLGFYSNEFPVVYVPAADWLDNANLFVADLEEWTEDVSDSFRFILEVPADVLSDEPLFVAALNKVKSLGEFCLGLVFQLSPTLLDNLPLFRKHLDMAQEITSVCIDKNVLMLTAEFKNILLKRNVTEVWHGEQNQDVSLTEGSLAISRISGDELDMAGLRSVIEVCLSRSNENCISVLCLDGNPPSLEMLRNADTILNLL